jgi:hypothetical protein
MLQKMQKFQLNPEKYIIKPNGACTESISTGPEMVQILLSIPHKSGSPFI